MNMDVLHHALLPKRIRGSKAAAIHAYCDGFRFDVVRWWENFRKSACPIFLPFGFLTGKLDLSKWSCSKVAVSVCVLRARVS